jgi:hypothetical protein
MRRLLLVLALTALFVASAFASGSALAQGEQGCEGLQTGVEAQTTMTLPPKEGYPVTPVPGQGDEHSVLDPGVAQQLHCIFGPP